MARTVTAAVRLEVVREDPPDDRILERAVSAGADYIVTGMVVAGLPRNRMLSMTAALPVRRKPEVRDVWR
jgi:hypothetical protein